MHSVFSNFIVSYRKVNKKTQAELIQKLCDFDAQFSSLDITTISRWENGKTSPVLSKQLLIVRALGGNIIDVLKHYCDGPLEKNEYLSILTNRTSNPYIKPNQDFKLKVFDSLIPSQEVINKIQNFHDYFIQFPIDLDTIFSEKTARLKVTFDCEENVVGHCLHTFCTFKDLKNNPTVDYLDCINSNMTIDDDILHNEPCVMNVLSIYSATEFSRVINLIKLLQRIKNTPSVKTVVLTLQYQEIFNFFESLPSTKVIQKGHIVKFGGIKFGTQNYSYLRISFRPEHLLSVKDFITFSVHGEHYLESLISNHTQA